MAEPAGNDRSPLPGFRRWVLEAWAAHVAVTSGLFESLRKPRTLDALAAEEGYDLSALAALVRGLAACGHIEIDLDGVCALTESARCYFLRDSESYVGEALSFLRTTSLYEQYPRILREGGSVGLTQDQWSYVTRGSAMYAKAGVETLVRCYPELMRSDRLRLLDVGCGQGTYLAELARVLPDMQAVGIDPTLRVAEEAKANLAMFAPRIRIEQTSLSEASGLFHVVLFNQIFHMVGVSEARALLRQARDRLIAGGHVFIQEIVTVRDDPAPALFGFNLRLLFERAMVFELDELMRMVADARFRDVRANVIQGPTPGLVYVGAMAPLM